MNYKYDYGGIAVSSSNDLIKFFTQEVVKYFDTPKQERKRKIKEPISYHWFGFMPLSFRMLVKQMNTYVKKYVAILYKAIQYVNRK